jgi:membrane-associated phospholipid phosphatase
MPYPFLLLLLIASVVGALVTWGADRLAPSRGATASAAEAVEEVAEQMTARRPWLRGRLDPEVATGLALSVALVITLVGGLVVAILALVVRNHGTLRGVDSRAADWGHDHATHLSTRLLQLVTDLGDWTAIPIIALVVIVVEMIRRPSRYLIQFILIVTLGDVLITNAIKEFIDRARPALNPIAATLGPSFPSGHSSTSAAFYASLALVLSRGRPARVRALLIGGAAAIAVAVASSRVLLDVHWVSDVIAGLALGWVWFAVCAIAFGGRMLRFGVQAEKLTRIETGRIGEPGTP